MKPRIGALLPGKAFWAGASLHVCFWLLVVNFDSTPLDMRCGEISCWTLFYAELPWSIFYISGSAGFVTGMSFVVGSLWWGVIAWVAALIWTRLPRLKWWAS